MRPAALRSPTQRVCYLGPGDREQRGTATAPSAAVTLPITPPPSCRVKKLLPIGGGKLPGGAPATARRAVDLEIEVALAGDAVVEPLCRRPRVRTGSRRPLLMPAKHLFHPRPECRPRSVRVRAARCWCRASGPPSCRRHAIGSCLAARNHNRWR